MELIEYVKSFPVKSFAKSETLMNAGDSSRQLLAIRDGFVKVASLDDSGRQKLLWIAGRYDLAPSEHLFTRGKIRFYYFGMSEGSVYCLDKADFMATARRNPEFMEQIARGLSEHYDDLLGRLNAVEQSDLRTKIIYVLHNLSERFDGSSIVDLHGLGLQLTHQDIADMTGATRESTSIELKKLKDQGLIDYSRSSFVVNYERLSAELE